MSASRTSQLVAPLAVLALLAGLSVWVLSPGVPPLPTIQGAWLMPAQPLPEFNLKQHDGTEVTPNTLHGSWHLISYGFTHCPDICPTTLMEIARFKHALDQQSLFNDLKVHFYTVDPARDSLA